MVSLKRNLRKFLYNLNITNQNLTYCRSKIFQDYRSLQNLYDYFISCARLVFCKCFLFCYIFYHILLYVFHIFIYAFLFCLSLHYFLSSCFIILCILTFSLITTFYLTKAEIKIEISLAQPSQLLCKKVLQTLFFGKKIQQNLRILAP